MKVDPRSYERNFMQLRKEAWKKFISAVHIWFISVYIIYTIELAA